MEVRITYRSEIYIKGNSIDKIRDKWESINLTPEPPQDEDVSNYSFVELVSVEDADSYIDLTSEFKFN